VFDHDVAFSFRPSVVPPEGIPLQVGYQACNQSICFRPMTETFMLGAADGGTAPTETEQSPSLPAAPVSMHIAGTAAGYMAPSDFLAFLDAPGAPDTVAKKGTWLLILSVLVGGFLLNLTPCVLPMIPINIAIIGAGAQAGSKSRGALLGTTYGLGIALAYGSLGIAVVLTGSRFGALNASLAFNVIVMVVFLALAAAMFGLFNIDFSRLQGSGSRMRKGSFLTAFFFGALAALLAGACVAPILITVLLWATNLYQEGTFAGLLLPFLLGAGMALPWPFAGAGLSFLPKPGKWMEKVKYLFGILILALAVSYALKSYALLKNRNLHRPSLDEISEMVADAHPRPVLLDFVSSTCTSCKKMDRTTFKDEAVSDLLARNYRFFKYNADQAGLPEVKDVLDFFDVQGFPTYIILTSSEEREP
jgi:thiol:disulfide interchange protein